VIKEEEGEHKKGILTEGKEQVKIERELTTTVWIDPKRQGARIGKLEEPSRSGSCQEYINKKGIGSLEAIPLKKRGTSSTRREGSRHPRSARQNRSVAKKKRKVIHLQ